MIFYWIASGKETVTCSATIGGTPWTGTFTFDVEAPKAIFAAITTRRTDPVWVGLKLGNRRRCVSGITERPDLPGPRR